MNAAVDEYHKLAENAAHCDYGFHVIVTDPTEEQMKVELPRLVERGITSVKVGVSLISRSKNDDRDSVLLFSDLYDLPGIEAHRQSNPRLSVLGEKRRRYYNGAL